MITFTHNDSKLDCDYTRTCCAVGYCAEDRNEGNLNAGILLTRKADTDKRRRFRSNWQTIGLPSPEMLTMTVGGLGLGHVVMEGNVRTLS